MSWNRIKRYQNLFMSLGFAMLLVGLPSVSVLAAERVVLTYRIFQRSLPVEDLTKFAETGETTRSIRNYLKRSGQDPDRVREYLTNQAPVDVVVLDQILNSFVGDLTLDQMSKFIHTESREADREALRSALVLSASDDGKVSLLEVIQKYPTEDVRLDGDQIEIAYQQVELLSGQIGNLLEQIQRKWLSR